MRILCVIGTRPEAIKLAPVVCALRASPDFSVRVLLTGQHPDLTCDILPGISLTPAETLPGGRRHHGLTGLSHWLFQRLRAWLQGNYPDLMIVQGDTQSATMAAMAAATLNIPVAHVEAGLRSGDPLSPYPEEQNRRMISRCARLHFAPTPAAAARLRAEGAAPQSIAVTGNTVIDNLHHFQAMERPRPVANPRLLVTCHRRENWGAAFRGLADALRQLTIAEPGLGIDFPLHPNPALAADARSLLGDAPQIALLPPLSYDEFLKRLRDCRFVLSDSGGVQEEAPFFGKYVLVLRNTTERGEAVAAGLSELTGTASAQIIAAAQRCLRAPPALRAASPFGDGNAAGRIVEALDNWRRGIEPILPAHRQFGARS